jgi:2-dehydro-3-deoxyphosphogluconate aldolase / (4S)-4-hydroxy-2-oxoglutarate aldolase
VTSDLAGLLAASRVVPVVRHTDTTAAEREAGRLYEAGFRCLELTTTIAGWPALVATLTRRWSDATIAVGTVSSPSDVDRAAEAGAGFLVSPYLCPKARERATRSGVPLIEGGLSVRELAEASGHGPAKLFPAHVGGPAYLRDVLTVLPGAQIMPTGGIRPEHVPEWLEAGAVAVGIGAALSRHPDLDTLAGTLMAHG